MRSSHADTYAKRTNIHVRGILNAHFAVRACVCVQINQDVTSFNALPSHRQPLFDFEYTHIAYTYVAHSMLFAF